jgi:type II secretory ATPase GspE/PulE/Tfp pilus assembly ATPase PilB-like protein
VARLLEMGVEPYQITSSLLGVLSQRLIRKRAPGTASGHYRGRIPVAQWVAIDADARSAILRRSGAQTLDQQFNRHPGRQTLHDVAAELVAQNLTDAVEAARVLGSPPPEEP